MPTYIVRAPANRLGGSVKSQLAAQITLIHSETTGAEALFAQVLFDTIDPEGCFIGGSRSVEDHCFIHGHIRAGRAPSVRTALIRRLVETAATTLRLPQHAVWVYLGELSPQAMAEYGRLLPEPGDEKDWIAALPEDLAGKLQQG